MTRCSRSSLGSSSTSASHHPGQGQAQDHRAGGFSSHRPGSPVMQRAPGYAHPPRPQNLEPGEPPEEEIRGTLGAQGLQAWPSRESWQRAGKILATFRVPSCSAQPLRVRVCKTDKTREASFENFLSETTQSSKLVSLLGRDNATGEGPEGNYSLRLADSLRPGSPRPGSAPRGCPAVLGDQCRQRSRPALAWGCQ